MIVPLLRELLLRYWEHSKIFLPLNQQSRDRFAVLSMNSGLFPALLDVRLAALLVWGILHKL
jgi:hypothetical protein